ncbi:MAG: hypothetical protein EXS32_03645 [Opitutus sp.]|nr:hypothetical protein [Opitutus sp.]
MTSAPVVIATAGVLTGETSQASVIIPSQLVGAAGGGGGGGGQGAATAAANTTYLWSITGGKLTTDPTRSTVSFAADTAGSVALSVAVTTSGTTQVASSTVTAISPASAGEITVNSTIATGTAGVTASVPPAQNADRTFRWTVSGNTAITAGQNSPAITLRVGAPGLLELTCSVTLQRLVTVNVRSFVVVSGSGAPAAVTIVNGNGSGTFPGGSVVDIFANSPPAGQVFDRWIGDTSAFGAAQVAPLLAHAIFTVPTTPVTLTATYKAAPAWAPVVTTNFNPQTQTGANNTTNTVSTTLVSYLPAGAQGVVIMLHDTGGTAGEWFNAPERALLVRDLVAAGYGVASLNSINRNTGAWSGQATLAANLDALNVTAALDKFIRDGGLTATKPVFFLGFSDGADTGARFANLLATTAPARPVKGVVLYCAAGTETLSVTSRVPQFFALAVNDDNLGPNGNAAARAHSQLMAGRGLATAVANSAASPVHPGRFRALGVTSATFTATDAQAIWTAVKTAGLLDVNNYLKAIPTADALKAALPAAYQARAADVAAQLSVAYAAQEFFSDTDARVINFLNGRVADLPAPAPGRMVNLSTRTKISSVGDTFALGFNISGPEKATLLIRGIGPALAGFGVPGAILAPRLEVNSGATVIASNEAWDKGTIPAAQIAAAAASVGAFALKPGDADTSVLLTLSPGSYTANLKGVNGATGDILAEVYDVSKNSTRLTNLSTIAKINEEGDLLVPGIVVQGANPRTLVIRAVGPGLTDFGIPASSLLGDPRITVLNATANPVATNNNWAQGGAAGQGATLTAAFPAIGAFPLKTANNDAALVTALNSGNYTLQAGAAPLPVPNPNAPAVAVPAVNLTGTVLVEVYEVP